MLNFDRSKAYVVSTGKHLPVDALYDRANNNFLGVPVVLLEESICNASGLTNYRHAETIHGHNFPASITVPYFPNLSSELGGISALILDTDNQDRLDATARIYHAFQNEMRHARKHKAGRSDKDVYMTGSLPTLEEAIKQAKTNIPEQYHPEIDQLQGRIIETYNQVGIPYGMLIVINRIFFHKIKRETEKEHTANFRDLDKILDELRNVYPGIEGVDGMRDAIMTDYDNLPSDNNTRLEFFENVSVTHSADGKKEFGPHIKRYISYLVIPDSLKTKPDFEACIEQLDSLIDHLLLYN